MGARLSGGGGRYALGQNSDINVTPFVDVMLVLLIIFMVALPTPVTSFRLNLPPAKAPDGPADPPTVISIQAGGIYIGDLPTSEATLPADLARVLAKPQPTLERIYIRADKRVRYQRFMQVMNTLQAAGFFQVALVNEEL
jgi:biopolymer transport protein ExbD